MSGNSVEIPREECESLRSMLQKEVELLERKLTMMRKLAKLLESVCGSEGFMAEDVALVRSRSTLRLTFKNPVSKSNPYIKYILKVLSTLQRETEGKLDYSVEEVEEGVKSIVVTGLDKDTYDEVLAAMEYVAKKLGGLAAHGVRDREL